MPVSERGSHPVPYVTDDEFDRLLKQPYRPGRDPDLERLLKKEPFKQPGEFDHLLKKPWKPSPSLPPSNPRVPSVRKPPRVSPSFVLGSVIPSASPLANLAPYIPALWIPGPKFVPPAGWAIHGPCMAMRDDIQFYRWSRVAVTSASCIAGQSVGGPNNDNYSPDAAVKVMIPPLGSGYQKAGYWGMYSIGSGLYRAQHRLSVEQYAPSAGISSPLQLYLARSPAMFPQPDPNNWPITISPAPPEAGQPAGAPVAPPVGDPFGWGQGGSILTETPTGPIGAVAFAPRTRPQPVKVGPTAPPGQNVREAPKQRGPARLGRMLFKVLDEVSEGCEVIDALFDALPNDAKKAAMKKQGYVWSPSAKKYVLPGDGSLKASDQTSEAFRPQGAGSRAFVDQFGQYGADGCEWKAAAIYANADRLDVCGGIQNIVKNFLEDKLHGVTHRFRPKNTVNALADADKEFGLQVNELLDELVDLCPK